MLHHTPDEIPNDDATEEVYRGGCFPPATARIDDDRLPTIPRTQEGIDFAGGARTSRWEIETADNPPGGCRNRPAHAVLSELGRNEVKLVVVPLPGKPSSRPRS